MTAAGFTISGKDHPICPVMLGDARLASVMAEDMLNRGEPGRELWMQTYALREWTASRGCSCMKCVFSVLPSCKFPCGLPQTFLASLSFSFWVGRGLH